MYDIKKRKIYKNSVTVKEIMYQLSLVNPNAQLLCCGDNYITLHIGNDGMTINLDNEDLDEHYEDIKRTKKETK